MRWRRGKIHTARKADTKSSRVIASAITVYALAAASTRPVLTNVGHHTVAIVHGHVQDAIREIAEVIGKVGVVTLHHRLVRRVAVRAEPLVGHEVVAEPVDTELLDESAGAIWFDFVFAIFSPLTSSHPCANTHFGGRVRPTSTSRASSPVLAQDVLADQVVVDRPPLREALGVGAETDRGAVVEQRVGPDVRTCFGSHGNGTPQLIDVG